MNSKIRYWIPLAIIITALCGLIYVTVQQNFRTSANDPQIQLSEDLASRLESGKELSKVVPSETIDISKSLAPFIIVYNRAGQPVVSTAELDGKTPSLPNGVLDYAKKHGQNRLTWQPKEGVRSATVITKYNTGYVLVGRSLREVENRENQMVKHIEFIWLVTLAISFLAIFIFLPNPRKK